MSFQLPPELDSMVTNMSPFQRKYCEFRASGYKQGQAAIKAGSDAEGSSANRVGYQTENLPGSKEYILFLQKERAKVACVDEVEIIGKLRSIYEEAMGKGRFSEACKAVELMGTTIGIFGSNMKGINKKELLEGQREVTNAFKEESEGTPTEDRIKKLQDLMHKVNKGNGNN